MIEGVVDASQGPAALENLFCSLLVSIDKATEYHHKASFSLAGSGCGS